MMRKGIWTVALFVAVVNASLADDINACITLLSVPGSLTHSRCHGVVHGPSNKPASIWTTVSPGFTEVKLLHHGGEGLQEVTTIDEFTANTDLVNLRSYGSKTGDGLSVVIEAGDIAHSVTDVPGKIIGRHFLITSVGSNRRSFHRIDGGTSEDLWYCHARDEEIVCARTGFELRFSARDRTDGWQDIGVRSAEHRSSTIVPSSLGLILVRLVATKKGKSLMVTIAANSTLHEFSTDVHMDVDAGQVNAFACPHEERVDLLVQLLSKETNTVAKITIPDDLTKVKGRIAGVVAKLEKPAGRMVAVASDKSSTRCYLLFVDSVRNYNLFDWIIGEPLVAQFNIFEGKSVSMPAMQIVRSKCEIVSVRQD